MHTCHHFRALPEFHRGVAHHNYCMSLMLATNIYRNLTPSSSLLLLIQDLGLGLLRFLFAHIVSFNSRISFCCLSQCLKYMFFKKTNAEVGMHTTPIIFALQIYRRYSKNNMVVCYFQFMFHSFLMNVYGKAVCLPILLKVSKIMVNSWVNSGSSSSVAKIIKCTKMYWV